jgi:drug/metabolite transporter (DMT)-like permease
MIRAIKNRPRLHGSLYVLLSAACFSTLGFFGSDLSKKGFSSAEICFYRFGLGAIVMGALLFLKRMYREYTESTVPGSVAPRSLPSWKVLGWLIVLGAIGYTGASGLLMYSFTTLPTTLAGTLFFLHTFIILFASAILLKSFPKRKEILATVIALSGAFLLSGDFPKDSVPAHGLLAGVVAATWYAAYVMIAEKFIERFDRLFALFFISIGATFSFFLISLALKGHVTVPQDNGTALLLVSLSVIGTVVPILAFFKGVSLCGPSKASVISTAEIPVTAIISAMIVSEIPGLSLVGGLVLILAGIVLSSQEDYNHTHATAEEPNHQAGTTQEQPANSKESFKKAS